MKKLSKNLSIYIVIFVLVAGMAWFFTSSKPADESEQINTSKMVEYLQKEDVKSINISETKITATLKNGDVVYAYVNSVVDYQFIYDEYIIPQVKEKTLELESDKPKKESIWSSLLPTLLMIGVMIVFFVLIMNQSGGGGKAMQFGKSRARLQKDGGQKKITFKDVAGLKEEKEELEEIVDFLKNPLKYSHLGARIPKGILLVGPPGTGKTYISRATAGEAGVPFFTISGSDFVEMFVGVGASRVRDLFEQAKKNAPCIVFIDEIDAVGRKRGAGLGGGHDEREQTLNQLLVEMDGFGNNTGIIVMAATNRPDILDPALLRPGRFDRQITIGAPDIEGREAILKIHTKNKPLAPDVDLSVIAKSTAGFTGAELENLVNEAALLAARRKKRAITMAEIEEATIKVVAGPEKRSHKTSEKDRRLTSYHEAGHAVVTYFCPTQDPVHEISTIPRGYAGGYTMSLPSEDRNYVTKHFLEEELCTLLGGRVAEKIVLGDISTGASNDIERATTIARNMVMRYGFSEKLGPMVYGSDENEIFLGRDISQGRHYSDEVASDIDAEIRLFIDNAYDRAEAILTEHRDKLEAVAQVLLEKEKVTGDEFARIMSGKVEEKAEESAQASDDAKENGEENSAE